MILIESHRILAKMIVKRDPRWQECSQVGPTGAAHSHEKDWDQPMLPWVMKVSESGIRHDHLAQRSLSHLHLTGSFRRCFLHSAGAEHPAVQVHLETCR